jgi:hypothetical protein
VIVPVDEAFSMTMAALRRGAIVVIPTGHRVRTRGTR